VTTLTVKTEPPTKAKTTPKTPAQTYPKITAATNCEDAVLRLLETDWGKWRPRTMEELDDAMKANDIKYPKRTLAGTLNTLADKGMVRRWNTNTGFVYILADEKPVSSGGETP
jgi:Fe2+ or Zn2+ uptake regulation protein